MENTEELEIDMEDIGTILKSNRLKQKKSLEEISEELCIRKIYLTAIEESDYETLPPIPYGVGYVRTYAHYLGLNPERAVNLYKSASQAESEKKEEINQITVQANKGNNAHAILGLLAVLIIYSGWQFFIKTPVENPVPVLSETEDNSNVLDVIENEVKEDENIVASISEKTEAELEEKNTEKKEVEGQLTEEEITSSATETKSEINEIPSDKVVVKILGETWIELKNKNKVYYSGVFHEGDIKEVEYGENMFISVGRPQNIEIYVKGQKKGIIAKNHKMNIPVDSLD